MLWFINAAGAPHCPSEPRWLDVAFKVQDSWKLEFHLLQTNHWQLLEGPVVLPKALQTPFFFFFSSPLTLPQPSGLTCRRDLLYLHHPCPPPVWVAIPLCTHAAITVVEFWPQIAPFLLPNWASWVLLSCTKPELTGPVLTHCPELGQGGKPGETKGTWEGKGDSRGRLASWESTIPEAIRRYFKKERLNSSEPS